MDLTDINTCKRVLRILHSDDDLLINDYISSASRSILNYVGKSVQSEAWYDKDAGVLLSGQSVPKNIEMATAHLVAYMYREPDSDERKEYDLGWLPKPVISILYQEYDPVFA